MYGLRGSRLGTFFLRRRQESQPARLRVVFAIHLSSNLLEIRQLASYRTKYLQQQDWKEFYQDKRTQTSAERGCA